RRSAHLHRGRRRGDRARSLRARRPCDDRLRRSGGPDAAGEARKMTRKPGAVPFFLGAAACALLLGFGYTLQYARGLEPCPLCLVQRGFFYAVGVVLIIAAVHNPARIGVAVYSTLAFLFAAG